MPTVTFTPSEAKPGDQILLDMAGFKPFEQLKYEWPSINFVQYLTADASGAWHGSAYIDQGREKGNYAVSVTGLSSGQVANASVTVTGSSDAGSTIGATTASGQAVKFPVSVNDLASSIVSAYSQSGYFAQLNSDQQGQALADPKGWLQAHPFLYTKYPQYFVDQSKPSSLDNTAPGNTATQGVTGTTGANNSQASNTNKLAAAGVEAMNWVSKNVFLVIGLLIFGVALLAFFSKRSAIGKKIKELVK